MNHFSAESNIKAHRSIGIRPFLKYEKIELDSEMCMNYFASLTSYLDSVMFGGSPFVLDNREHALPPACSQGVKSQIPYCLIIVKMSSRL